MRKRYYIAYGSNLNVEQMAFRCPDAVPVGTSQLNDWRLLFKGSKTGAYLTIEKQSGYQVPVAVWAVSAADEAKLDRYEGYPKFYYKKEVEIALQNETKKAFVYIMHEERQLGVPTNFYVETCRRGYETFGFDESILFQAIKESREGMSK